jgi:hypothetical protein
MFLVETAFPDPSLQHGHDLQLQIRRRTVPLLWLRLITFIKSDTPFEASSFRRAFPLRQQFRLLRLQRRFLCIESSNPF